jgi:hypothetical protein
MDIADWVIAVIAGVTAVIAVLALGLSGWQFFDQRGRNRERDAFENRATEEAAETQLRLLKIEETRHEWEQEERDAAAADEARAGEEASTADITVRFGFRDSAHSWGRVIATNNGPADALNVELQIFAEDVLGDVVGPVKSISGEYYGMADALQPTESVHIGVSLAMIGFSPEDLRYRITWVDSQGEPQSKEGRVPVP